MPTYDFRNKDTDEVFTKIMKIAEREQYLKENPNIEPVVTAPNLVDPIRLSGFKTDNGFKEVLQKVHERTPGSQLNKTARI